MSVDQDLAAISGASPCFCPWQSLKEDTTSSISSSSLGGDPSSLCSLSTSRYKDWISSLLVWVPTRWTVGMSTSGSSFGNSCQQPWQTFHSASFIEHHVVVGAICIPLGLSFKEQLDIHHPLCLSD